GRDLAGVGVGQQPGELGLVDEADRVATAAGGEHLPGQAAPLLRVAGKAGLAGPAQPDIAADAAGEPRPARHARTRQLEQGRRVLAEGRDGRERTGGSALSGPLRVDEDRPHPPVDQVDRDRPPEDPGSNPHAAPPSIALHGRPPARPAAGVPPPGAKPDRSPPAAYEATGPRWGGRSALPGALGGGDAGGDRPAAGGHDSGEVSMRRRVRDVLYRE